MCLYRSHMAAWDMHKFSGIMSCQLVKQLTIRGSVQMQLGEWTNLHV